MYALRGVGVSLAFFLTMYCLFSVAIGRGWRIMLKELGELSARTLAGVLLTLRVLPCGAAAGLTLGVVVPSFVLFEPRVSSEPLGEVPLFLGMCCLVLFAAGAWRAAAVQARTARIVADWLAEATEVAQGPVVVFRTRPAVPALMVAGVCAPRVLVSDAAAAVLSARELEVAMKHELAHMRGRDNLKKLLFHVLGFAGMAALEAAWAEAAEMAADDSAVGCADDALELASALIKLSRFAPVHPTNTLTTALLQDSGMFNARVARLLNWEKSPRRAAWFFPWRLAVFLPVGLLTLVLVYRPLLSQTHNLTEWLVR